MIERVLQAVEGFEELRLTDRQEFYVHYVIINQEMHQ